MECLQAAVCVDYSANSVASMRMYENHVSFYVEQDDETKFWHEGQCEVVGEGIYDEEAEGVTTLRSSSPLPEYEMDEDEFQLALAISKEDPQMDGEMAKRLSELDSVPHVPRFNAQYSQKEASSDKQRLLDR